VPGTLPSAIIALEINK